MLYRTGIVLVFLVACTLEVAAAPMLLCDDGKIDSVLCREFKAALDARADAQVLRQRIQSIKRAPLDDLLLDQIGTGYAKGETLFETEYFGDAARRFSASVEGYRRVLDEYEAIREDKLLEADLFLDEKRFKSALATYELVESWETSGLARKGIELSRKGLKESSTLKQINKLVEEKNYEEASSLLSTVSSQFYSADKKQFQKEIGQGESDKKRDLNLILGFKASTNGELQKARDYFKKALVIDPKSQAAKDGLKEVDARLKTIAIIRHREQLDLAQTREDWLQAMRSAQSLLKIDTSFTEGSSLVGRFRDLSEFEVELDFQLDNPDRLGSKKVRIQVNNLLLRYEELASAGSVGNRIADKNKMLGLVFRRTTRKQELVLISDNKTFVKIVPGQQLGQFKELIINIIPGQYRISGRRPGYKEAVKNVSIEPDGGPYQFTVISSERF